ncbi:MAG: BlaI/MecI/CopY family transcriptional regulator [Clostridia bacterium]|nr:BlaI/MecI/CopY family transcriptional regulator [Clostridia bacterium]
MNDPKRPTTPTVTLSDGEWKLMKLLWEKEPRSIAEMVGALSRDTGWTKTTVFVMLKRLIAKGAVRVDDTGRIQQYYPVITRADVVPAETDSFLDRVFDGSVGMMMSSLAGRNALKEEDIAALRKIIADAERNLDKNGGN